MEPNWWSILTEVEKAKHVEALVRNEGWKAYHAEVLARDGRLNMPMYFSKLNAADKSEVATFWLSGAGANGTPGYVKDWVKEEYLSTKRAAKKDTPPSATKASSSSSLATATGAW